MSGVVHLLDASRRAALAARMVSESICANGRWKRLGGVQPQEVDCGPSIVPSGFARIAGVAISKGNWLG